jgi:response regulator RpfG family c-di-GMP phosphodiesterase
MAEKKVLRQQPIMGANIVRSISSLKPIVPIILHHRERFDGQGYPSGLKGEEIPIGARIVAVTDAFSAMMSHRVWKSLFCQCLKICLKCDCACRKKDSFFVFNGNDLL